MKLTTQIYILLALFFISTMADAITVKANIKGSVEEIKTITNIIPTVERVLNSAEFKERVLGAYHKGKQQFADTKHSNITVYETLTKNDWLLHYEFATQKNWLGKCPVLGWTYPSTKTVWFNKCNFKGRKESGIAGTICHEQAHKLGYSHSSAKSSNSVPYAVGTICAELYEKYKSPGQIAEGVVTPKVSSKD